MAGNQPEFLTTKVQTPRNAPGLIERRRLTGLAEQLEARRLAVIRAGAGFGKTSIALAWMERLRERGHITAWLTLDPEDSEPVRFLFYVAQSLRRACGAGEASLRLISDISLVRSDAIAASLINELAEIDEEVFLVIDDYHLITDDQVHSALAFIVTHVPRQFHLVLTTRTEPPLQLPNLRAQNLLLEIDAAALRFDEQETRQFFHAQRIAVSDAESRIIHAKTEGWPALLRILASTIARPGQSLSRGIRALSGTARPIGAYLDEMLRSLPQELVAFMLRTAILDRLSASLCEAVTGVKAAETFLDTIAEYQPLLASMDQEGRWFRYHPILAEYLGQRLAKEFGDEVPALHRRAYNWYAARELRTQAVQHAIAAGDIDQAVFWIKRSAMSLVKKGDLLVLMDWLRLFPAELMRAQLEIRIAIAWGMALALRLDETLEYLHEIDKDLDAAAADKVEILRGDSLAIRSVAFALKDDSDKGMVLAETCLRLKTVPWTANVASNVAVFGHLKAGNLKGVYGTPWIPFNEEEVRLNLFAEVYRHCLIGIVEFQQLHLATAERHYLDSLHLAEEQMGPNSIAAALPASLLAQIRYEQSQLDEAEALVIDRIPLITAAGMLECAMSASLVLARVAEMRGNVERAYSVLEQTEALAHGRHWGRLAAAVLSERVRLLLSEGRHTAASAAADRLEALSAEYRAPKRCAWSEISIYAGVARARLALAEERPRHAVERLRALRAELEAAQNRYGVLRVEIVLATALIAANERAEASTLLRGTALAAASAGLQQMFLEPGAAPLVPMLETPTLGRNHIGWSQKIAAHWQAQHRHVAKGGTSAGPRYALSAREGSVLELIGAGQSNKEIARTLDITPETVKSHVKNIFTKLAVDTRAQAVTRAQTLGLAPTHWQLPPDWPSSQRRSPS